MSKEAEKDTRHTEAAPEKRAFKQRLRSFVSHVAASFAFFALLTLILVAVLWREVVITVPAGSVGVMWYRFFGGTVTDDYFNEGLKVIFPWDKIYIYDARPQRSDYEFTALTKEGLTVGLTMTVTTIINRDTVGILHKAVGPQYIKVLVEPTVFASVRELVAGHSTDDIYDLARASIEPKLTQIVNDHINEKELNTRDDEKLVTVSRINIRTVQLPPEVAKSIEEKQIAEQAALRYQFVLDREKLESKRKEIEALGVKRFQEIVTPTISEEYLRWRGIDATLQLALSPNSKVVVIGNGRDGLPLIFDTRSETLTVKAAEDEQAGDKRSKLKSSDDLAAAVDGDQTPPGMDGGVDSTWQMENKKPKPGKAVPVEPLQTTPKLPPLLP